MKKIIISILPIVIFTIISCGSGKQNNSSALQSDSTANKETSKGKYQIKSGIVHYKTMDFGGVKSTETLYFDDFGNKEYKETDLETSMMGYTSNEKKINISMDGYSYTFDISKMKNGKNILVKEIKKRKKTMMGGMSSEAIAAMGEEMKKQMDFKDEGTEIVAGVVGKKVSMAMDKTKPDQRIISVTYKNILLKSDMGGIQIVVDKLEENADIPSSKFVLPSDYNIIDTDTDSGNNASK
jgi:hypothetical protein